MSEREKGNLPAKAGAEAPPAFWPEQLRSPVLVSVLLALVMLVVFLPVRHHDFVNYDDSDYVTANAHVQSGLKWENVAWAFQTGHASNWHPLTWLSHMLDCQLFGQRAGAQHLASVGFHIANTLLLFVLLRRMTGTLGRSACVAALFALHPLHVESVAWVSERKDVLSALFFLLTLGAYVRYAQQSQVSSLQSQVFKQYQVSSLESSASLKSQISSLKSGNSVRGGRDKSGPRKLERLETEDWRLETGVKIQNPESRIQYPAWFYYALALVCFAFGLMSKPMLVTTPFVLVLLDYWPLRRSAECRMQNAKSGQPGMLLHPSKFKIKNLKLNICLPLLREKLPFFALSVVSSVITFVVQRKGGAVSTALSLDARVANAVVSYVRYIGKLLCPLNLSVLYPHPGHWPVWQVAASAALLLAVSGAVLALARRRPYLVVGWLWFIGMLVPVIGLVQVGIQSMADRYMYVPVIGLLLMLVWGVADVLPERPWRVEALTLGSGLALAACAFLTAGQLQHWQNSETLFRHAVEVTPNNYLAYNNLGYYLSGQGRVEEAMDNYRLSLKINPTYEDALNNLGYALAGQKKYAEAIPYYEAALRTRPNHVEVHNNFGNALSELGRLDEAIAHYLFVLKEKPDHADAHNNLGIALAMQGKLEEAIRQFHEAIRFKPDDASAHSNLGNALAAQRKFDEAIKEYRESLRLKPDDAQAHNNLANALAEQGRTEEAVRHYTEALRLNANNPEAHYNLGTALLRQGNRAEAVVHYQEAVRLKPDYTEARRQLEALAAPARN